MIARGAHDLHFGFILAAIAVFAVVTSPYVCGQEKTESQAAAWSFVFRVVDDDGVILKDATIKSKVGKKRNGHRQLPNGDFRVTYDSKPTFVSLYCRSDGKTPINATWRENEMLESSEEVFVVTLPTPKPTGGRILDPEGDPIEGATVYVLAPSDGKRLRASIWDFPCKTDAQGKWTCPVTPSDLQDLWIRLEHPDYISDQTYGGTVQNASIEDLQARTHVAVMRKGITVSGIVTGPDAQPVPGAAVYQGSDRHGSHYPKTKTDKDGNFAFTNCAEGKMVLTVVAKDLAPELIEIDVDEDFLEPVNVKLTPGKMLTIKVVDPEGNPIPKAWIPVDGWRGHRSLANAKLPSRTDDNGVFVWKNAPEDEVQCEILVKDYLDHRNVKFTAREEPYIIKKIRPLIISGTVVDAESGKPLEQFKMTPVGHFTSAGTPGRRHTVDGRNGKYEFKFTYPKAGHSVLIEAVGYKPEESTVFKSHDGQVTFDFKLKKDPGISATVVSADGNPVPGAVVALNDGKRSPINIGSGRVSNLHAFASTSTSDDGSFSLAHLKEKWSLVVCHDLGFAQVDAESFEPGQTLTLSPWVIIAGKDLKSVDSKTPVILGLSGVNTNGYSIDYRTAIKPDGSFEFGKVPQGNFYSLSSVFPISEQSARITPIGRISAVAGERHQILLGRPGRNVFGKLEFEGQRLTSVGYAKAKLQRPYPEGYDQWDEARQQEWETQFSATEEGIRYQSDRVFEYAVLINSDNDFEVKSLPPGFYELEIQLGTDRGDSYLRKRKLLVKKIAAGEKDPQPQDLGVIEFSHPSSND